MDGWTEEREREVRSSAASALSPGTRVVRNPGRQIPPFACGPLSWETSNLLIRKLSLSVFRKCWKVSLPLAIAQTLLSVALLSRWGPCLFFIQYIYILRGANAMNIIYLFIPLELVAGKFRPEHISDPNVKLLQIALSSPIGSSAQPLHLCLIPTTCATLKSSH